MTDGESSITNPDAASDPIDVSVIVVSYNTREMTLACLRSIVKEARDVRFEVLFIDNRSDDGSFEAVESEFGEDRRFHLVFSEENLGFAGGNNEVAHRARGRYLLLLNPDTVVLDTAIDRLVEFADRHPEYGIWGGGTVFADGSLNPTNCWGDYTLWSQFCRYSGLTHFLPRSSLFNPRAYVGWARDSVREVAQVTGCFFLMRRSDWERLGGFDPDFFMYAEEADLCLRARRFGIRCVVTPDAVIVHHGGASEKKREDKIVRLLDAELRLLRRHWAWWRFQVVRTLTRGGVFARHAASSVFGVRREAASTWTNVWRRRREWS